MNIPVTSLAIALFRYQCFRVAPAAIALHMLLAGAGCQKIVDFQATAYQPRLTFYGALLADSLPVVMVGRTQTYYGWIEGNVQPPYIENADVRLVQGLGSEKLVLGPLRTAPFDIWDGQVSGLQDNPRFYRIEGRDTRFRFYEGSTPVSPGTWYDFTADAGEDKLARTCYVPKTAEVSSIEVVVTDSSYRQEAMSQYEAPYNVVLRRFYLRVRSQVEDTVADLWHKHSVTYRTLLQEYYVEREEGYLEWVQDTITASLAVRTAFERVSGPGLREKLVGLGNIQYRTYEFSNGGERLDTLVNLPMSRQDARQVALGRPVEVTFQVATIMSHQYGEVLSLRASLSRQGSVSTDPLNPTEPVTLAGGEGDGLGFVGGFSLSKPVEVKVVFE